MSLFDLPSPLYSFLDGLLRALLPEWAILVVWGLLGGAISMGLYRLISPQDHLKSIKAEADKSRAAMIAYDGDFDGLLALVRRSLWLSFRHVALTIGPVAAASLPMLCLIAYVSNTYSYLQPAAGSTVEVHIEPVNAAVKWEPPAQIDGNRGTWRVLWPASDKQVRLAYASGSLLASFPLPSPAPMLQKFTWWNFFFGNPAGYIPLDSRISSVEIALAREQFVPVGPEWLRGWEGVFFLAAGLCSLFIKIAFNVH
jgi:hypothetical protein